MVLFDALPGGAFISLSPLRFPVAHSALGIAEVGKRHQPIVGELTRQVSADDSQGAGFCWGRALFAWIK